MIIMQYEISLPADYDMAIIKRRIAEKGAAFDTFSGLGLKCFVVREKGQCGASANEYSPIYLWPNSDAMGNFIAGPAFAAVNNAFGRPITRTWSALAFARSQRPHDMTSIGAVTQVRVELPSATDLTMLRDREVAAAWGAVDERGGPIARAVGVDPTTWQLVRFDYWQQSIAELSTDKQAYSVLHVSAPEIDALIPSARIST
jgi:hypothetical protein